ncbi:MAG: glycoside hydrolase family 13 protein [Pseudomonadota bacterium]
MKNWLNSLVFDTSRPFILNPLPAKNEKIKICFWVNKDNPIRDVVFSSSTDADLSDTLMQKEEINEYLESYYINYDPRAKDIYFNFVIITNDDELYFWDKSGVHEEITAPNDHFHITTAFEVPAWIYNSVFYQIFPDRFYFENRIKVESYEDNGYKRIEHETWEEDPFLWDKARCLDFFGGNLDGIRKKIPYFKELGINALYLTPIFKSPSNHKYDTENYFTVDESFGTNDDLVALINDLHENGIKIILDGVLNHTGDRHRFFNKQEIYGQGKGACHNKECETYDWYVYDKEKDDFHKWASVPNLPCLNYKNPKVREFIYKNKNSVVRNYLNEPYNIDGWRLDVVGEVGNCREKQLNEEVLQELRVSIKDNYKDKFILGEITHRGSDFLMGDKLDSIMNYEGMTRPIWGFVGKKRTLVWNTKWYDRKKANENRAKIFSNELNNFLKSLPAGVQHFQSNFIGNHDTPRIKYIAGEDEQLLKLASVFQFTFCGVPFVYYGDEVGLSGEGDPMNRKTFPWNNIDEKMKEFYKSLIKLRSKHDLFKFGSYKSIYKKDGCFAFARILDKDKMAIVILNSDEKEKTINIDTNKIGLYVAKLKEYFDASYVSIKDGKGEIAVKGKGFRVYLTTATVPTSIVIS